MGVRSSAALGAVMLALVAEAAGCQQSKPAPVPVQASAPGAAAPDAAPQRTVPVRPHPPAQAWARWPMPNARLSGLPHGHDYDTQTEGGVVIDRVTGLMWQRTLSDQFLTFADAQRACDQLTLAGHHDWRLPSRIELTSLIDTTRTQPSIDVEAFPLTPSDWFWTSSLAADDPNGAWYVYFYFGYPKTDDVTNKFSVRCVRQAQPDAPLPARYEVLAHEVRDIATGLRWQRAVAAKVGSFDSARAYCSHLRVEGKRGWRVPTLVELLTLIDERAGAPMIDRTAFPDTPAEPFWSSSTFANGSELAWYVRFDHGNGLYGRLIEPFRVRCVL